ncbi:MAG: hypothetical protein JRG91_07005 [Deltaproteobacteria bacterium]|nr:hypothetical protein [Deltaproteobacteria bacterium]
MRRLHPWMGTPPLMAAGIVLVALGACDQDYEGPETDAVADLTPDPAMDETSEPADDTGVEPAGDPVTEPAVDPTTEDPGGDCTYPAGPYAFSAVGNTVGPMRWPSGVAGPDETHAADLEALFCDPDVHSVFVQIVTTT